MKKLVRIEVDGWSGELKTEIKKILRETEHTVFVGNTKYVRNRTGPIRTAGPFNKKYLGEIFTPKPGTKHIYFISEAEDPVKTQEYRSLANRLMDEIMDELTTARIKIAKMRTTIKG